MPQAARLRSRAPIVFFLLALLALPAFAGEPEGTQAPRERGFLVSLWQLATGLVPVIVGLGPGHKTCSMRSLGASFRLVFLRTSE